MQDLADAILAVIKSRGFLNKGFESISSEAIDNLENQYKIYFIEPDNDEEFQNWQKGKA